MDLGCARASTRRALTRDPVDRESVEHHLGVHPVAEPLVRGRLESGDRLGGDAEELLEVQVSSPSEERLALCIALPYRIRCPKPGGTRIARRSGRERVPTPLYGSTRLLAARPVSSVGANRIGG